MSEYSRTKREKQAENMGDRLAPGRYDWRGNKLKTYKLSHLYMLAGMEKQSALVAGCCTMLRFGITQGGRRYLRAANFCHDRLCPLCTSRKARRTAEDLSEILTRVEQEHPSVKYIFVTLSVRNCSGEQLPDTLTLLTGAWRKLSKHRDFERAVHGWFRSIEITRSRDNGPDLEYHPHIHAVLAVLPEYFDRESPIYLTHEWLVSHWRKALRVDYDPSVRLTRTYLTPEKRQKYEAMGRSAEYGAAMEAAKYPVKICDYITSTLEPDDAARVVREYATAAKGRRFTAFGGWLKDIAKAMKLEPDEELQDLTDIHDQTIRDDITILYETYGWTFGAGDYILEDTREAPEVVALRNRSAEESEDLEPESEPEQLTIQEVAMSESPSHWNT